MKTSDFNYDLPESLIAQEPMSERASSRLLVCEPDQFLDNTFTDILDFIRPNDVLVFNNTKVIPARLWGTKATGGKVELLVERVLSDHEVLAHVRANKSPKPGSKIHLEGGLVVIMIERQGALFKLQFQSEQSVFQLLEQFGHMPLPPYIKREDTAVDASRYQTVYAKSPGAVAAPTAGLHFTEALLSKIKQKGAQIAEVTLHVGAGTFQPVRVDVIEEHEMHTEYLEVTQLVCDQIATAKARGGRVIAVGTTSVRSLETAAQSGVLQRYQGDTNIFLYPGKTFHCVDMLITNFHLPESTLLMLVSAFSGSAHIQKAYQHAIANEYRFFSYGDAMLLYRQN